MRYRVAIAAFASAATAVFLLASGGGGTRIPAREAHFDSHPAVDGILKRACADCHSGATHWPWYGAIPPASWLLQKDIREARAHLDLAAQSNLSANQREEIADAVRDGSMPPRLYVVMHANASLSKADIATLNKWAQ